MRFARSLALALLSLCARPAHAQPQTQDFESVSETQQVDGLTQTEDVGFRDDEYERMTVSVRLAGTGPYRFLVDTGADRTAISRELADRLNLPMGGGAIVHSATGPLSVETARMPALQLTDKEIWLANAPLLNRRDIGADGILGIDSLRSQRVLFDFERQTMSIVPSATRDVREEEGAIVIRARERNGRLILSRAVADGTATSVILDTGSQLTIGNTALRRKLMRQGKWLVDRTGQIELRSVTGGKLMGDYVVIRELVIGGATLTDLAVVFADAHTFRQLGLDKKPAVLLGMNAMRAFDKVSIDFANRKLRLVLPETSDTREIQFASSVFTGQP